jgi:hypothetical protein
VDTLDQLLAGTWSSGVVRWSNASTSLQEIRTIPVKFYLSQNYPNPFNPATTISYFLPSRSRITLKVFNILGETIRTLADDIQAPGEKTVVWDARNEKGRIVGSGVYIYQLQTGSETETKKMMFLK